MAAVWFSKHIAIACLILLLPANALTADRGGLALRATPAGLFIETEASSRIRAVGIESEWTALAGPRMRILPYDMAPPGDLLVRSRLRRAACGSAESGIDTVRVLLVRVSFESDRLDALSSLSTGGGFDLSAADTSLIDPTPHDRGYFASHLEGLSNYYRFQSCDRLVILGDVAPEGEEDTYRVSDPADYGPGSSGSWTSEDLVRFFRDCILAADRGLAAAGYPMRFGDYDAVVVAHAGANLQSDVRRDTPNDVPSFFASLGPVDEITVDGGATVIRDGSVIPETACQDGLLGGIAGVFAHEFGHQLGLPDLYDTRTGRTTIGYWDLMDAGAYLGAYLVDGAGGSIRWAEGFVPGGLSAWSRSLLGWTTVERIAAEPRSAVISAAEKCPVRALRVEHAEDEYFLAENRAAELDDIVTGFVRDTNGVIIGTGNCLNCGDGLPDDPVWTLVNGYDLLLPTEREPISPTSGPGMLVWRINERLVADRSEANALNAVRPLAVTLLEADGVADIGDPSSPHSYGWHADAYYAGGNESLGERTYPPSFSVWGVPTGGSIENIGSRDTVMHCSGRIQGATRAVRFARHGDLLEDGFMPLPGSSEALLLHANGDCVLMSSGDTAFSIGRPVIGPPAWIEGFSGALEPGIAVGEQAGYIHAFKRATWTEYDGWPAFIGAALATHPVVVRREGGCWIAAAAKRSIHIIGSDGEEGGGSPISFFERDIASNLVVSEDEEGSGTAVFFVASPVDDPSMGSQSALLFKWDLFPAGVSEVLDLAPGYPKRLAIGEDDWSEGFSLVGGDLVPSEAGDEACVICRATGRVLVFGEGGLLGERAGEGPVRKAPALHDLNGDSWIDLVYSDGNSIHAMSPSGANLMGWPKRMASLCELPWESRFSTPITIAVSKNDCAIIAGSDGGLLYVFDGRGAIDGGYPRKAAGFFSRAIEITPSGEREIAFVDGGDVRFRMEPLEALFPLSWHTLWGNVGRTAWGQSSKGGSGGGDWHALDGNLIVYPNPSRGSRVVFHFTAPSEGNARLEILTLTGELVLARTKRLHGGEEEFVVSMGDRASGVYVSRLVVQSGEYRLEAARTFAIVR